MRLFLTDVPEFIPIRGFRSYEAITYTRVLSAAEIRSRLEADLQGLGLAGTLELMQEALRQIAREQAAIRLFLASTQSQAIQTLR